MIRICNFFSDSSKGVFSRSKSLKIETCDAFAPETFFCGSVSRMSCIDDEPEAKFVPLRVDDDDDEDDERQQTPSFLKLF